MAKKSNTKLECERTIVGFRLIPDIGDSLTADDVTGSKPVFYSTCNPSNLKKVFHDTIKNEKKLNDKYSDDSIFKQFEKKLKATDAQPVKNIDLDEIVY